MQVQATKTAATFHLVREQECTRRQKCRLFCCPSMSYASCIFLKSLIIFIIRFETKKSITYMNDFYKQPKFLVWIESILFLLIGILLAIEIIKELPITLIMRPFNFETFATKAYIYASQDLLEAAAAPSLFLIIIASFFILITSKYILKD